MLQGDYPKENISNETRYATVKTEYPNALRHSLLIYDV